jgi:hypothetical protein
METFNIILSNISQGFDFLSQVLPSDVPMVEPGEAVEKFKP